MNEYFASVEFNFTAKSSSAARDKIYTINKIIEAYLGGDCGFVRDGAFEPQYEEEFEDE